MKNIKTDKVNRFSLEIDVEEKRFFISFPVSNTYIDYEEYYEISEKSFHTYLNDMTSALTFVNECKNHEHDDLILQRPGRLRGEPS